MLLSQPFIFHWRVFRNEATWDRIAIYLINIAFGLFLTVTGVVWAGLALSLHLWFLGFLSILFSVTISVSRALSLS